MMLSDVEPGLTYEIDHDEDGEVWLVLNVIARTPHTVKFMELALTGSNAGQPSEASFQAIANGMIGGRVLGRAGR